MSQLNIATLANLAGSESTPIADVINGSARAWCNFNGTGTVAIRASYNVSSITDNGTGDYTVNFTNALKDSNYSLSGTASRDETTALLHAIFAIGQKSGTTRSASSIRLGTGDANNTGGAFDMPQVNVAIFR